MQKAVDDYFKRRDELRHMHRTMTLSEYNAWCHGGDAISSSNESNPFPGGLTIIYGEEASYIGKVDKTSGS